MLVKVKTLTGKEIEVDVEPTDKIERIKERVEEKEGIPPPQQSVERSLKHLNTGLSLAESKWQTIKQPKTTILKVVPSFTSCWPCEVDADAFLL